MESEKLSLTSKILLGIIVILVIIFIIALTKIISDRSKQILTNKKQTSISTNKEVESNMYNTVTVKTQENNIDPYESIDVSNEE